MKILSFPFIDKFNYLLLKIKIFFSYGIIDNNSIAIIIREGFPKWIKFVYNKDRGDKN